MDNDANKKSSRLGGSNTGGSYYSGVCGIDIRFSKRNGRIHDENILGDK